MDDVLLFPAPLAEPLALEVDPVPLAAGWMRRREDREFARMEAAFAGHGGLLPADVALRRLRLKAPRSLSGFARAIVARTTIAFKRGHDLLVPMFQFDPESLEMRPGVAQVVAELVGVFDEWELALWFATPNGWLSDAAPVELVALRPDDVQRAARADRYVAAGH